MDIRLRISRNEKFLQMEGAGLGQSLRVFPGEEAPAPSWTGEGGESGGEASNRTNIGPMGPKVVVYIWNTNIQTPATSRAED